MNIYEQHYQDLAKAKAFIGHVVTGRKPGLYTDADKITGRVVSVRESISDYGSFKPAQILVDIHHGGTVTPRYLETVERISAPTPLSDQSGQ